MRTSYIEATFPPRESTTTSGLRSEVRRRSFVVKEERDRCDQQNGLSSEGRKKKKKKKQDERNDYNCAKGQKTTTKAKMRHLWLICVKSAPLSVQSSGESARVLQCRQGRGGDERGVSIVASSVVGLDPCGQLKNVVKSVQVLGEVRLIPFVAAELWVLKDGPQSTRSPGLGVWIGDYGIVVVWSESHTGYGEEPSGSEQSEARQCKPSVV